MLLTVLALVLVTVLALFLLQLFLPINIPPTYFEPMTITRPKIKQLLDPKLLDPKKQLRKNSKSL